jgi:DNA-binding transcriptional ArsR family regulator
MEARRDVFQAIADPTRRAIISLIAQQPQNVNAIAEKFDMTRQAVSLHVKILTECGLLEIKQQGRERYCEGRLEKLSEVAEWVTQYKQYWNDKLDSLELYLKELQAPKRATKTKRSNNKK